MKAFIKAKLKKSNSEKKQILTHKEYQNICLEVLQKFDVNSSQQDHFQDFII